MAWKISELDKAKTEQSIVNETIRLDGCHKALEKLINEVNQLRISYENRYYPLCEKIDAIKKSIESGEQFIEDCQAHLENDF